jgi:hypothetical protein
MPRRTSRRLIATPGTGQPVGVNYVLFCRTLNGEQVEVVFSPREALRAGRNLVNAGLVGMHRESNPL